LSIKLQKKIQARFFIFFFSYLHGIGNLLDKVKENNLEKQYIFKTNISLTKRKHIEKNIYFLNYYFFD